MQLVAIAVDHVTAPVAVRERVSLAGAPLERALARLRESAAEGLILSTCNRTEYYAYAGHDESGRRMLAGLLREVAGPDGEIPDSAIVGVSGEEAVRRLFAIASGARSMVTGESDILRQLKLALAQARAAGVAGERIHRLCTSALAVGKRVRERTAIGRRRASIVSVALDAAGSLLEPGTTPRVVIVGAGETAQGAIDYLRRRQWSASARLTIVARRAERAAAVAASACASTREWDELGDAICEADLVVCCTSAADHVIGPRSVLAAQRVRRHAPLVFVDLATPRDVDPMVRSITGVSVIDLDEVQAAASVEGDQHAAALAAADVIIDEHVDRYMTWWRSRQVAPVIAAFVARGAAIRDQELERALSQLAGLSAAERRVVTLMAARLTSKLLHTPLAALNRHPEEATMVMALRMLFDLDSTTPDALRHAAACPAQPTVENTDMTASATR